MQRFSFAVKTPAFHAPHTFHAFYLLCLSRIGMISLLISSQPVCCWSLGLAWLAFIAELPAPVSGGLSLICSYRIFEINKIIG